MNLLFLLRYIYCYKILTKFWKYKGETFKINNHFNKYRCYSTLIRYSNFPC